MNFSVRVLRGAKTKKNVLTPTKKKKKERHQRTKHLRKLTPKAPAQKAQQGVSIRKCTRSLKPKRPEEIQKKSA